MLQDFYRKASQKKLIFVKIALIYGIFLATAYTIFRAYYINFVPQLAVFSVILYLAELHTLILLFGFLYSLWPRKYEKYISPNRNKKLQINVFITTAGEPTEIVSQTILAAKKAADFYSKIMKPKIKPRVIVLNDGKARGRENWKEIRDLCKDNGVFHVARKTNEGFKAGNINNGLKKFPSKDTHNTIDCFLDADFCARENFLLELMKPLVNEEIDFVQSPQRYKNMNTWVAQAAGAHQIFFFDFICPAKAYDNALFLCGTNYAIRREALLSAGGVDNRFVTEDYATSIRLHLNGNRGVFVNDVLAVGMAPMNLKEYFNQQTRWCKGCLDANGKYIKQLFFGPLNLRQKFHYFLSTAYYFIGIRDLILVLAPLPYLFWGTSLIRANTIAYLAFIYLPLIIFNFILFFITFKSPVKSLVLDIVSFPVFAMAFVSSVIKYNLPFTITIKKYERENPFRVYLMQLTVALVLLGGLLYSIFSKSNFNIYGRLINYFWAAYDSLFLLIGFVLVIKENYVFKFVPEFKLPTLPRFAPIFARAAFIFVLGYFVFSTFPIFYDAFATSYSTIIKTPKTELIVPSTGVYYGYYQPELNSHPQNPKISLGTTEKPSLSMFFQGWDGTMLDLNFLESIESQGAIPVVTWEPLDTVNSKSELNIRGNTEKVILSGKFDSYIRSWAQSARQYKKPLFIRFAHEPNGDWYPWGTNNNEYIQMWRHVHDIFESEHANNVLWVWSPNNTDTNGNLAGILDSYPGSNYVDWVGFSAFNWGTTGNLTKWQNFKEVGYEAYQQLSTLGKPIMVSETSSVSRGGNKSDWLHSLITKDIPSLPKIKAVVFYDQDFKNSDFNIENSQKIFERFLKDISTSDYFLKKTLLIER